jgi:hypothetical protein
MLEGKMADVPGCMACEATFPYPVRRKVVSGSHTPLTPEEAEAMLPLYVQAARELAAEGVAAITANCGLIALLHQQLAAAVPVPVVTSGLLLVPTLNRMMPHRRIGILTFQTAAVGERNYRASGWSSDEIPVALGGVGESEAWLTFLRTKEVTAELRPLLEADLIAVARRMLGLHPDIGCFVSECTLLPAAIPALRQAIALPVYDILTLLDLMVAGTFRPAASLAAVTA